MATTTEAPRFQQYVPAEGVWTLVQGDKFTPQLVYESEAGERILVPNAWGNQPPAWRAGYFEWTAARHDEQAARMRANASGDLDVYRAEAQQRLADKCRALAAEYRAAVATSNRVEHAPARNV